MSTPPQPAPPRRRTTGIRRPRVAGRVPGRSTAPAAVPSTRGGRAEAPDPARPGVTDPEVDAAPDPEGVGAAGAGEAATDRLPADSPEDDGGRADEARRAPTGKRRQRNRGAAADPATRRLRSRSAAANAGARRPRKPMPLPVLAAAMALMVGLTVFFGIAIAQLRGTPAAQNTALVDIGTTALVSQQVDDALKTIYSFDYTRLDQNEAAARAVITPGFAAQFDELFGQVRQLAPQQQAVVTATVNLSAVESINGDTAVLLVFLDQQATRAQAGTQPQQLAAAGRLTVTAQRVDGTWKVADVQPR